jgi:hypothetical protein
VPSNYLASLFEMFRGVAAQLLEQGRTPMQIIDLLVADNKMDHSSATNVVGIAYAERLDSQGHSSQSIQRALCELGMLPKTAATMVAQVRGHRSRAARANGSVRVLAGIGAMGIGALATYVSYALAAPGGTYLVATGAMVVGVYQVGRGVFELLSRRAS